MMNGTMDRQTLSFADRLLQFGVESQNRVSAMQKKKEESELDGFTFKPFTNYQRIEEKKQS